VLFLFFLFLGHFGWGCFPCKCASMAEGCLGCFRDPISMFHTNAFYLLCAFSPS
jgi:hypothetical protein